MGSVLLQVVPLLLHLVKAISSVRLYIPKDLRSLDSRQSVGKSIQVTPHLSIAVAVLEKVQCAATLHNAVSKLSALYPEEYQR